MKESMLLVTEIGASQYQISAAKVKTRNKSISVFKAATEEHAKREHAFWGRRRYRRRIVNLLSELDKESLSSGQSELSELNYASEPPQKTAQALIEQAKAKELYASVSPQVRAIETEILLRAPELKTGERMLIAGRASVGVTRMSSQQKEELLGTVGLEEEEAKKAAKKIGFSIALGSATGTVAFFGVNFFAGLQKFHPLIQHITDWKMAASYAAFYGSTALVALTNKKLLDEPSIKTSANGFPTAAYYLLPKFFSEQKKEIVEKWGVWAGTFLPNITGEVMTWGLLGTFAGLQGVMGRNIGSTIADLVTVIGNLGWLHYKRRKTAQTTVEKPLSKKNISSFLKPKFFVDWNQHGYTTDTVTIDNYYSTAKT